MAEFREFVSDGGAGLREMFRDAGLQPKRLRLGFGRNIRKTPYVVFDHRTYPQIEAHLFTIADSAMWIPEILPNGDVIIFDTFEWYEGCGFADLEAWRTLAWMCLAGGISGVMEWLEPYRSEPIADERWAHQERDFLAGLYEVPPNEPMPVKSFIGGVDHSIRRHIRELNRLGFPTIECCSGISRDHPKGGSMLPYVFFDDEAYCDVSAHLFTLANMAGWEPSFGAHGYDVMLGYSIDALDDEYLKAWDELVAAARKLDPVLKEYRKLMDRHENTMYAVERMQRDYTLKNIPEALGR